LKVLILGATGMAGHTIAIYFIEAGHDVTAFSRSKFSHGKNINGDVTDFNLLERAIEEGSYDAVINAVGILKADTETNKPLAVLINSYLPHKLCYLTQKMKTRIIHLSTDCVFSGKTGGYRETSFRDGESFYDRSKALGEFENDKDLVFRTSIIGPDMKKDGIGLFNWFMKQSGVIKGYNKAMWTGVTTPVLAKAMERAILEGLSGLYHLVNNEPISKYELLRLFNEYMKEDQIKIIASDLVSVDKSLVNSRSDFSFIVPGYDEMVSEMKVWIEKHRNLYLHYCE